MDMPLVKVTVTASAPAPLRFKYAVVRDLPFDEVCALARANPRVYIFPFYTGTVESMPDFMPLYGTRDVDLQHIWKPFYVGNLSDTEEAIRQIVGHYVFDACDLVELSAT